MMAERFKMPVAVFLILEKDGKIWLQRRFNTGYRDGHYDLPSGHVDGGESAIHAVIREGKEEAGVDIRPDALSGKHILHNNDGMEYIQVFFKAEAWTGEPKNMEPDKCDDSGWFPLRDLPQPMIPHVAQALQNIQNDVLYSDMNVE